MSGGFLFSLLICVVINFLVSSIISYLIPNYYLATIVTSVIIAFIYSIWSIRFDRIHFYKQKGFWIYFFVFGCLFLACDFLVFIL